VHVRADSNPVASKESKSYEGFDVVIATDIPLSLMVLILVLLFLISDSSKRNHAEVKRAELLRISSWSMWNYFRGLD